MNKKAQAATLIAIILGVFLVGITVIKFGFNNDNKKEENKPADNNKQEEYIQPDYDIDIKEEGEFKFICTNMDQLTDVQTSETIDIKFMDNKLESTDKTVIITYTLPENKQEFEKLIIPYNQLIKKYYQNQTVINSEELSDYGYYYTEVINYLSPTFKNDASDLDFDNNTTIKEALDYYKKHNYSCTQS